MSALNNPVAVKCILHLLLKRHGPARITQVDLDAIAGEVTIESWDGDVLVLRAHDPQQPIPVTDEFFPATVRKGRPQ